MRGTNQGGSLAGFIIIGVLLTLVLVGGLYGLNRYNAQRADDQIAADQEKQKQEDKKEAEKPAPAATERTPVGTKSDIPPSTDKPAASPAPAQVPATGTELPQTGPADAFFGLIVLGLVTFASVHYARSRS